MSRFVRLLDGSGAAGPEVSGKAAALDRLVGWGFPVPAYAAVTVAAYRSVVRQDAAVPDGRRPRRGGGRTPILSPCGSSCPG